MLTDRQENFVKRMKALTGSNVPVSADEQQIVLSALSLIETDWEFKPVINQMNLSLRKLSESQGLSPQVERVVQDLVAAYGQPDESITLAESKKPKDWKNADPDKVYVGSPFIYFSQNWVSRNGKTEQEPFWKPLVGLIFMAINFFLFFFTAFPSWLYAPSVKLVFGQSLLSI
ncbi:MULTISPECIES: hypothetical protein [unclassified Lactococcus]|uniref:hypothetical protein n=1 Tax=unclassified Lactococcus TaxID=2643510 RepID=UPI0011CB0ECF|nr:MULTISPECIES: hypothetical protein [unclassified Lactococcus]MQW22643.1 hypothetical protein [Lactococcus sp. dk101]TXK45661.1 hypothetical protein FVP42_01630 [Lactococcus sp. dk310]TXK51513.1 hypothetical protein FVP43_01635 [Lactococcus sp. dk322]